MPIARQFVEPESAMKRYHTSNNQPLLTERRWHATLADKIERGTRKRLSQVLREMGCEFAGVKNTPGRLVRLKYPGRVYDSKQAFKEKSSNEPV